MRFYTLLLLAVSAIFSFFSWGLYAFGYRINISDSLPKGIWKITKKEFSLGSVVLFCPPYDVALFQDALKRSYIYPGFCKGGYAPLMKKVVALYPDRVALTDAGIKVNGEIILGTKPFLEDSFSYSLPFIRFKERILTQEEVILAVPGKSISFDARYFGPINKKYIIGEVRPIFVFQYINLK